MFSRFAACWMTSPNINILLHEKFTSAMTGFLLTQKVGNHFPKESKKKLGNSGTRIRELSEFASAPRNFRSSLRYFANDANAETLSEKESFRN